MLASNSPEGMNVKANNLSNEYAAFNPDPRHVLPILGVRWHYLATEREARRLASWAERHTRHHERPCEAFVYFDQDMPGGQQWTVKLRNW